MNRIVIPAMTVACMALTGCTLPSNCAAGDITGLIHIESAKLTRGEQVGSLTISNVTRNKQAVSAQVAVYGRSAVGGEVKGVRPIDASRFTCDVACQFGTPGEYVFEVSAPGAKSKTVSLNIPGYDAGGCGGVITGTPVRLNLVLEPTAATLDMMQ